LALNTEIKSFVRRAGFSFGIATDSGGRDFWSDPYEIRRIPIFPGASAFSFIKKTSGWYHRYKRVPAL